VLAAYQHAGIPEESVSIDSIIGWQLSNLLKDSGDTVDFKGWRRFRSRFLERSFCDRLFIINFSIAFDCKMTVHLPKSEVWSDGVALHIPS